MSLDALDILDAVELPAVTAERLRPRPEGWSLCSASQLALHGDDSGGETGCPRRWWISAVAGETEPEQPHQAEGRRLHAEVADYLTKGTQPGPVASTTIEYLPPVPVPAGNVERPFALAGLPVMTVGAVDVAWTKPDRIAVRDLKFVSSIRREHRQQDLSRDPQAILYSAALQPTCRPTHRFPVVLGDTRHEIYQLAPASVGVEFCKIYASRSAPKAELVGAYFGPRDIDDGMARIAAQMLTMVERSTIQRVDQTPANPNACRSYGVMCPHRGLCDLIGDSVIRNPFAKNTADVASVNAAAQAELMAPPPPTPPASPAPQAPPAPSNEVAKHETAPTVPYPSLEALEKVARDWKAGGFNRNAGRPNVADARHYQGFARPTAELVEHALCNVYGQYVNLGDADFALSEHRRLRSPFASTPEQWSTFLARWSARGVPVPTLWDIACYVYDGSVRAEERGYKYEPPAGSPPVETLPAMSTEDKAAEMAAAAAPPAPPPPAPKPPKRAKEAIPDHPLIPVDLRGALRQQITLALAGRALTSLVVAAREAGHDIMARGNTTRRELLAEIADVVELLTGQRPWGAESDDSAEAPPAPPVPSSNAAATAAPPAPPAPAPPVPPSPPEPPASSDVAGGVSPSRTTVYVDCLPMGVAALDFSEWVAPYEVKASDELGHDYRLAKFRDGYRLVASLAYRALRDGTAVLPEALFVSTRHPLFEELESIIAQFAPRQVRAVR